MPQLTTEADASRCPACKHILNGAASANGSGKHRPRRGDVSICFGCGERLQFIDAVHVESLTVGAYNALTPFERHELDEARIAVLERLKKRSCYA